MYPSSTSNSERSSSERHPSGGPVAIAVVTFFLLLLAGTGLVDTFLPAPRPDLIGPEARADRVMHARADWRNGSMARVVEHDLRLVSRVRRTVGPWYSLLLLRYFDQTTARAVAGRGGWIYIRGRIELEGDSGVEATRLAAARIAALNRRLALHGIRLVVIPVPRKAVVHPEPLPRGSHPRPNLDELLVRSLKRHGVATADLLAAWKRRMEPGELAYFQTDSHWTDTAQLWAAEESARAAGTLMPVEERQSRLVSLGTIPQERDTLQFLGLHLPGSDFDFLELPEVPVYGVARSGTAKKILLTEHQPPRHRARQALFGTSFSAERRFPLFLEHFTQEALWNAAEVASFPLEIMADKLTRPATRRLETLYLEMPNHQILGEPSLPGLERIFTRLPPPMDPPPLVLVSLPVPQNWAQTFAGRLEMASLPAGQLAHAGDGSVELLVEGRVEGKVVELVVEQDGYTSRFAWPAGERRVVVPLTAPRPVAGALTVAFEGEGIVYLERLDAIAQVLNSANGDSQP